MLSASCTSRTLVRGIVHLEAIKASCTSTLTSICIWERLFAYGVASVCKWELAGYIFPGFKKNTPIYKRDRVSFANGRVPFTNGSYAHGG